MIVAACQSGSSPPQPAATRCAEPPPPAARPGDSPATAEWLAEQRFVWACLCLPERPAECGA